MNKDIFDFRRYGSLLLNKFYCCFYKSSSFDTCTKYSYTHIRFICRIYKQPENPFFKELLAHKYETIENGGRHLRFLEKWPTFPH